MTDSRRPSQPCPYYCCSDFDNADEPEPNWTADLSNDIHPMFQNITFGSEITKEMQSLTTQSLRLASRFLTMDSVSLHILTMAQGEIHIDKKKPSAKTRHELIRRGRKANTDEIGGDKYLYLYPKPAHKLTSPHLRRDADTLWKFLTYMVQIHFCPHLRDTSIAGLSQPVFKPLRGPLDRAFPRGCPTLIRINPILLEDIHEAKTDGRMVDWRIREMQLAQTICHELGHALSMAVFGDRRNEPMKLSAWAGEAGYDLEAAIFGGQVALYDVHLPTGPHVENEMTQTILVLNEWPSDLKCMRYMAMQSYCAVNARPAPFTLMSRLSRSFVAELFHDEFWNARENSPETLRPKGIPSWIMAMPEKEYGRIMKVCWGNGRRAVAPVHSRSDTQEGQDKLVVDDTLEDLTFSLRVIEHDEEGLDEDIAHRLRDIIRRQWEGGLSRDPADIMDSAVRPWSSGKE